MPARTRSAPAAFGRGVTAVVANPGLLLAPCAFGGAVAATFVAAGAAAVLLAGRVIASGASALERGAAAFSDFLEDLRGSLFASPGIALLAPLSALAAGLQTALPRGSARV